MSKSSEEQLRKACVNASKQLCPYCAQGWPLMAGWLHQRTVGPTTESVKCRAGYINKILAGFEHTDLERLREWLKKGRTSKGTVYNQHILRYIADEFGVGGEVKE